MVNDPRYPAVAANPIAWQKLRFEHDFEFWCATCVKIHNKLTGLDEPFVLNAPQRRVVRTFEADRLAGRPIRAIIVKTRQFGGSTITQMYISWIQICLMRNWNSVICSNTMESSANIRAMQRRLLENYPPEFWDDDTPPELKRFEGSANTRYISGRGCKVTTVSIKNHQSVRGSDIALAHFTEVGFWTGKGDNSADNVVRSICGSVALARNSVVVMESTANGVGNFLHSEWLRCRAGLGDKRAIFVPWYELETNRLTPPNRAELADSLTGYELELFTKHGCDLDQIWWYRQKSLEYRSPMQMQAEYPTDDDEAFVATNSSVFSFQSIESMRRSCYQPQLGDIHQGQWYDNPTSNLKLWKMPEEKGEYIAAVDVGGRSEKSDWSVIAVMRTDEAKPEVVAQWRGHVDLDILAEHIDRIGRFYNDALMVVESNTLETDKSGCGLFILDSLAETYPNIYRRRIYDDMLQKFTSRVGFHTNRATKEMIISGLVATVRTEGYIERDVDALNELLTYEQTPNGSYAAKPGAHDDILMTRALALHAASHLPPLPPIDDFRQMLDADAASIPISYY
jgi:hypothetical protein